MKIRRQRRDRIERVASLVRYPVLLFTYVFLVPVRMVLEKTGCMMGVYRLVNRPTRFYDRLARSFGDYQPTESDVLVCTYFKSGTNWGMQMAFQIATRGQGEFEHVHDVVPWPDELIRGYSVDVSDRSFLSSSPTNLRVIKTHLRWEDVPFSEKARYITVLRDPKDVFVSSYHFARDVALGPLMPSVASWLDCYLSDEFFSGTWASHLHSYWKERHRPNLLILTFREMKEDMAAAIRRIAEFLGVEFAEGEFDLVCYKCGFDYMKSIDHKFYPGRMVPWAKKRGSMMRKGQHGSSSELLSKEQQARIDAYCRAELARLGSDFPYEKEFGRS